jgi:hypothetical protein
MSKSHKKTARRALWALDTGLGRATGLIRADQQSVRQTVAATTTASEVTRGTNGTRKSVPDESKAGALQNGTDDSHAIAAAIVDAQASQPAPAPSSRKRKAAAAASATQPSAATAVATRRGGNAMAQSGSSWSETNLLTFENCKGRPQDGRMVADDGTELEANGKGDGADYRDPPGKGNFRALS